MRLQQHAIALAWHNMYRDLDPILIIKKWVDLNTSNTFEILQENPTSNIDILVHSCNSRNGIRWGQRCVAHELPANAEEGKNE